MTAEEAFRGQEGAPGKQYPAGWAGGVPRPSPPRPRQSLAHPNWVRGTADGL